MTVKQLIEKLEKVENKDALIGFTLWMADGPHTFYDGMSPRNLAFYKLGRGSKLEVVAIVVNANGERLASALQTYSV